MRGTRRRSPTNADIGRGRRVRGDLIGLLQQISKNRARFAVFSSFLMSQYLSEMNTSVPRLLPLSDARLAHEILAGAPHKVGKIALQIGHLPLSPIL